MSVSIFEFQVTVPAGTTVASHWSQAMTFPVSDVVEVDILVPPGPRGQVGFALGSSGSQCYPYTPGTWIVTDDAKMVWQLEEAIDSGSWQLFAYNLGTYPHTIYLTFQTNPSAPVPTSTAPITALVGATISM